MNPSTAAATADECSPAKKARTAVEVIDLTMDEEEEENKHEEPEEEPEEEPADNPVSPALDIDQERDPPTVYKYYTDEILKMLKNPRVFSSKDNIKHPMFAETFAAATKAVERLDKHLAVLRDIELKSPINKVRTYYCNQMLQLAALAFPVFVIIGQFDECNGEHPVSRDIFVDKAVIKAFEEAQTNFGETKVTAMANLKDSLCATVHDLEVACTLGDFPQVWSSQWNDNTVLYDAYYKIIEEGIEKWSSDTENTLKDLCV